VHSTTTHNEFLRLRVRGLSLACIGRQLGVSKPTLIKWSRASRAEIDSRTAADHQRVVQEVTASATEQLADLRRKHNALKQELLSRALRDVSTANLETLAGEFLKRIETLEGTSCNVHPTSGTNPVVDSGSPSAIQNLESSTKPNPTEPN